MEDALIRCPNNLLNHWKATEEETELKTCKSLDDAFCACLLPQHIENLGQSCKVDRPREVPTVRLLKTMSFPLPQNNIYNLQEKLIDIFKSPDSIKCQSRCSGWCCGGQDTVLAVQRKCSYAGLTPSCLAGGTCLGDAATQTEQH